LTPSPPAVDRRSHTPLHQQIYEHWRDGVLSGRFRPGERVRSTRELAEILSLSRITVTAAYDQLIAEGYLESKRGSGTFVCRELPDQRPRSIRPSALPGYVASPVRLSHYGRRLPPQVPSPPIPPGFINLSRVGPDFDAFPFRVWRRLMTRHMRRQAPGFFDRSPRAAGFAPLREEIARYVARARAVDCTAEQVLVVNGSQQAIDLAARVLLDAGDHVAIEEPGYPGARTLFAAHGAHVHPVRVSADGLAASSLPDGVRLVYVTPSHQFPSGVSMSLARRLELIEWARRTGAVLIEDDYDSEYRYSGPPLPAMQSLAHDVPVVYIGTFSNVMFPDLRIGYVVLPRALLTTFARAKWLSDRNTPLLEQAALADFLREGHFERHVRRTRRLYKRRRDALVESLGGAFGSSAAILGDAAGIHLLVRFASQSIGARAQRNRVHLASAERYYASGRAPREFIMGFSAISERAIREGIKRLTS